MYYTRIDLHKKTSYITIINEGGKIVSKGNFKNVESDILDYFVSLTQDTRTVIESMAGWYWLYDLLTAQALYQFRHHANKLDGFSICSKCCLRA